jgi:iron(III) transport system ATP-binding protein
VTEVLNIKGVGQSFGATKVLDNSNFSLDVGERLAVLGPSGSGKTTLLRLIAGLEAPTTGEITVAGKIASRTGRVLIAPEHREVALVFQGLALFPHLNALDQIAFASRGRGGLSEAKALLDAVGLGHRATAQLDQLSGGERQRIALARALAQEPKLILMDEPFASLDDEKRGEMRHLLRSLLEKRETTLILVTHSREDAFDLARRVIVLEQGRTVANDLLETVLSRPHHAAAARSLGLGQIIEAEVNIAGEVHTAFGKVNTFHETKPGRALVLVRPGQVKIVTNEEAVEAEVVSIELRPAETREVRRIAIVRKGDKLLRLFAHDHSIQIGSRVRVQLEDGCELLEG